MSTAPTGSSIHLKRRLALMLFGGLVNASLLCAPAIASRLSSQLHYGPEQIGTYFSLEFGGYVAAGFLGRHLLPRYRWRVIAAISLAGFFWGNIVSALVLPLFSLLIAVRLFTTTCGALLGVVCMASANADPYPSRALALYIVGQLAIGVVGLAVFPMLFQAFGLISYFLTMTIFLVSIAGTIPWLTSGKGIVSTLAPVRSLVRSRRLLLRFPALLLFYAALGGVWTFVGEMASAAGINPIVSGRILSLSTIAGILGAMTAYWLGKTLDIRRAVVAGYALLIAGVITFLFSYYVSFFILAVLAFKFAWTFVIPYVMAALSRQDPGGQLLADVSLLAGIGLMVGPPVAGRIMALGNGYVGLLATNSALLVMSGACAYLLLPSIREVTTRCAVSQTH